MVVLLVPLETKVTMVPSGKHSLMSDLLSAPMLVGIPLCHGNQFMLSQQVWSGAMCFFGCPSECQAALVNDHLSASLSQLFYLLSDLVGQVPLVTGCLCGSSCIDCHFSRKAAQPSLSVATDAIVITQSISDPVSEFGRVALVNGSDHFYSQGALLGCFGVPCVP